MLSLSQGKSFGPVAFGLFQKGFPVSPFVQLDAQRDPARPLSCTLSSSSRT